ncbi:MAG TPA: 4-hydroxy-tetrahydrodipicolinate reductase [Candidatus Brocadiia bacterium]|nr:4-hydroxy-tetrahydrodipicolinate reductase [Candidatus Brocadiia bacterium]
MIRIGINGACGRMGRRIATLAAEAGDIEIAPALETAGHSDIGKDFGQLIGTAARGVQVSSEWPAGVIPDVLIDFSSPEATVKRAAEAAEKGVALVIGTTGLTCEHAAQVREASKKVPCILAANMSVGVNVLLWMVSELTKTLGEAYDVEIIEIHHNQKKDAPSGTAKALADSVCKARNWTIEENAIYGRQGIIGPRPRDEMAIHAVRAGDVVGDHTVFFSTGGERIEVTHRAHNRDTFASGALRAARYLTGKPAGMYSMADVLGIARPAG